MFQNVWFQKMMIRAREDCITAGYYRNIFNDILFQNTSFRQPFFRIHGFYITGNSPRILNDR